MSNVDNSEDVIDSRDVIDEVEELSEEIAALTTQRDALPEDEDEKRWAMDDAIDEARRALCPLEKLAAEASQYSEGWEHGAALVRDSYFTEYAQELAEEIGAIESDAPWPVRHIDWEAATDELKHDYTCVEFDGVDYWVR